LAAPHPATPLTTTIAVAVQLTYDSRYSRMNCASTMTNERKAGHLETCWRVVEGSTTRILKCAVFHISASGLELRVGYMLDVPLHSESVADIHAARALAQDWLTAMRGGASPRNLRNRNVEQQ
jgi:hypothetical protein